MWYSPSNTLVASLPHSLSVNLVSPQLILLALFPSLYTTALSSLSLGFLFQLNSNPTKPDLCSFCIQIKLPPLHAVWVPQGKHQESKTEATGLRTGSGCNCPEFQLQGKTCSAGTQKGHMLLAAQL